MTTLDYYSKTMVCRRAARFEPALLTKTQAGNPVDTIMKTFAKAAVSGPFIRVLACTLVLVLACSDSGTGPDPDPPRAAAVSVSPTSATLTEIGATAVFAASITDQNGAPFVGTITWSSEAASIFSVDADGAVTALANGSGSVRATFQSLSDTATVTVAANRAPVAIDTIDAVSLGAGDDPASVDVTAYFSDPDDDDLAVAAASADETIATASVSGSVVSVTPAGAGGTSITVTATDPGGLSAEQTFDVAVTPANQAPVAVGTIDAVSLGTGDDPASVDVAAYFSDPDDDKLAFAAASGDETIATASVSGSVVSVTPAGAGGTSITVTATDPGGLIAEQTFGVTVTSANRAPVASGTIDAVSLGTGDDPASVDVAAHFSDPDDDKLAFAAASGDETIATASVSGSVVSVTPAGAGGTSITVTATDPGGLSAEQTFDVAVKGPNQAPVVVDTIASISLDVDYSVVINARAYFSDPDDDELTFAAASGDETIAKAGISDGLPILISVSAGETTATLTATDPGGLSAEQTFVVVVEGGVYIPMEGLKVANGRIELQGSSYDSCVSVDGLEVGDDTYTVHTSKWQTRSHAKGDWEDIDGTEKTGEICPLETETRGDYRLVGDMTWNGIRRNFHSENFFRVE